METQKSRVQRRLRRDRENFPRKSSRTRRKFSASVIRNTPPIQPASLRKTLKHRHRSRLRRRCVLWRKSARLAARSRKICVVKTRNYRRIFAVLARGARKTRLHFPSACGVKLLTSAHLSLESMQHLATQKFAFSTEIAQIFCARKAKNSRSCCKIFASFSVRVAQFS